MADLNDVFNNPEALKEFNSLPRTERIKVIGSTDPDFKQLKVSERFKVLDTLEVHQPTAAYEALKSAQTQTASKLGSFAQRAMQAVGKVPGPLSQVPIMAAGAAKIGQEAVEHPKEALEVAGGLAATPFTGGASLIPTALAVGAGTGIGNLTAQAGEQILKAPGRQETAKGVAKEAGIESAKSAALTLALGAGVKLGAKAINTLKTAFSSPNVQSVEKSLEMSNQALGEIEARNGLDKVLPKETPSPQSAGDYANKLKEEAKNVKDLGTEILQQRKKEVKTFFDMYPKMKGTLEGKIIAKNIAPIKEELGTRVPDIGREVAKNKAIRDILVKETEAEVAKQGAKKQVKKAVMNALKLGLGYEALTKGKKVLSFFGD